MKKVENPIFNRFEIRFRADHTSEPTPKRLDVRAQLANQLGIAEDLIVIEKLASTHGQQTAFGIARTYDSRDQLEKLEPKYLLQRGLPKEAKAEEKKAEEKPKEEKKVGEKPKVEEKKAKAEEKAEKGKPVEEGAKGGKEG